MVDLPGSGTAPAGLAALSPEAAAALLLAVLVGLPLLAVVTTIAIGRRLHREDAVVGWCRLVAILYTRWFQKLTAEGTHHIPRTIGPEGLVIVSTHGAGLDPVSMQALVPHPIRWMMSAEMMLPSLGWLWRRLRIIPVCFDSRDAVALKTAIGHVASGGVLGIFPEGSIERPPRKLRRFSGGLRLILSRTKARVLVVAIDPGDGAETAYAALLRSTRPHMRFLGVVEPGPTGHGKDASDRIFEMLRGATGWEINEEPAGLPDYTVVDRNLRAYGHPD
jgi:1-acyl-sn-glycerol-3-phosphate acyltransferase